VVDWLWRQVIPNIRNEYWSALKGGWAVSLLFLPLEFATFRFLPLSMRVLVVNLTDVAWTAVVSFFSHLEDRRKHEAVEDAEVDAARLAEAQPGQGKAKGNARPALAVVPPPPGLVGLPKVEARQGVEGWKGDPKLVLVQGGKAGGA
jgi:hypothetical protein